VAGEKKVHNVAIKSVSEDAINLGDWGCGCSPKMLVTSSTPEQDRAPSDCSPELATVVVSLALVARVYLRSIHR
jgi:hypothetical protein